MTGGPRGRPRPADGLEEWMAFFADPDAAQVADPHGRLIAPDGASQTE